jgi:hypothetical protein
MERKYSFNEIPELYESMRPLYPAAMMDDIQQMSKIHRRGRSWKSDAGPGRQHCLGRKKDMP